METGADISDENRGASDDTNSSQQSESSGEALGENPTLENDRNCIGWECLETGGGDASDGAENTSRTDGHSDDAGGSESTGLLA
jgi:hypothetical protein